MSLRWIASFVLVAILIASGQQARKDPLGQQVPPREQIQDPGQRIFEDNCMRCHGPDGSSDTFIGRKWHIPDLRSADVQKLTPEQRIDIITHGKNKMPEHEKKLTAEEIRMVEGYVRELGKKLTASPAK